MEPGRAGIRSVTERLNMSTPSRFLPPPWWRRALFRARILIGYYTGRGYWFWRMRSNELYWNPKQCSVYGIPKEGESGTYETLFDRALWDDQDRDHVRKTVEQALEHQTVFTHQFCAKDQTTGEKLIIDAAGWWLFDRDGDPWAMVGWNRRLKLRAREFAQKEAAIKLRQELAAWRFHQDRCYHKHAR